MTHATHPWLSNDGYCRVVGHPELVNWNPHCNLGKIVKETVQEFCERPPILVKTPLDNTKRTPTPQENNQSLQHGGGNLRPGPLSGNQARTGPALSGDRLRSTFSTMPVSRTRLRKSMPLAGKTRLTFYLGMKWL